MKAPAPRLYIMSYITHRIILVYVSPEDALARNLEQRTKEDAWPSCNTSPNRLSYDAVRYPLRLSVCRGTILSMAAARITYQLAEISNILRERGSSLTLSLSLSLAVADKVPRSYNLRAAHAG